MTKPPKKIIDWDDNQKFVDAMREAFGQMTSAVKALQKHQAGMLDLGKIDELWQETEALKAQSATLPKLFHENRKALGAAAETVAETEAQLQRMEDAQLLKAEGKALGDRQSAAREALRDIPEYNELVAQLAIHERTVRILEAERKDYLDPLNKQIGRQTVINVAQLHLLAAQVNAFVGHAEIMEDYNNG